MHKAIAIGLIAAATASSGCSHSGGGDNGGPSVDKTFQVGPFRTIEVAGPYDVDVTTGGAPAVSASGPEKIIDRLVVEVRGDRLLIHPREEHGFFHFGGWSSNGSAKVRVSAPALSGATIAGSGGIRVDRVAGDSFEGDIAGSGDLNLDQVAVKSLKLSIGGSGDIRAKAGEAGHADYGIAGSGGIDAGAVRTQTAKVSIAGSGGVQGQAAQSAQISIMGSGDVTLTGGAKCSISKMGSGNARCS